MQITKEEFLGWLGNPVTQEVHQVLRERMELMAHGLARGSCLGNEIEHGKAVGRYGEIKDLLDMTYEDIVPPGDLQ